MPGIVRPGIGFGSWHIRIRKDDGLEPYCTTYIEGGQAALAIPSALIEGRYLRLRRVACPKAEQADLVAAMKLTLPDYRIHLCLSDRGPGSYNPRAEGAQ